MNPFCSYLVSFPCITISRSFSWTSEKVTGFLYYLKKRFSGGGSAYSIDCDIILVTQHHLHESLSHRLVASVWLHYTACISFSFHSLYILSFQFEIHEEKNRAFLEIMFFHFMIGFSCSLVFILRLLCVLCFHSNSFTSSFPLLIKALFAALISIPRLSMSFPCSPLKYERFVLILSRLHAAHTAGKTLSFLSSPSSSLIIFSLSSCGKFLRSSRGQNSLFSSPLYHCFHFFSLVMPPLLKFL